MPVGEPAAAVTLPPLADVTDCPYRLVDGREANFYSLRRRPRGFRFLVGWARLETVTLAIERALMRRRGH